MFGAYLSTVINIQPSFPNTLATPIHTHTHIRIHVQLCIHVLHITPIQQHMVYRMQKKRNRVKSNMKPTKTAETSDSE